MHDIDRVRLESDAEFERWSDNPATSEYLEAGPFEYDSFELEAADAGYPSGETPLFCENSEAELATELLEVTSDAELEGFLGKLIQRASRAAGNVLPSHAGRAIGGVLKGAARQVMPSIGSAIGGYFGKDPGAGIGRQGAAAAGRLFGLELEGLSGEDQEFEVARRFARFAGDSVRNMTRLIGKQAPDAAARNAATEAARVHAPGFLKPQAQTQPMPAPSLGQSGQWMRRGRRIILYGV